MDFKKFIPWKRNEDTSRKRVDPQFDLAARTENLKRKLEYAGELAKRVAWSGREFAREGYSTGGFSASVVTASGRPDGEPKTDPVTLCVADKSGAPLFTIAVLPADTDDFFLLKGSTPAVQEKLDSLPENWGEDPIRKIEAVMAALTPEREIAAAIATVKQGALVFGDGRLDLATRAEIEEERRQRIQAANDIRERETAEGATVLQSPTTVGGPLRLKTPKA